MGILEESNAFLEEQKPQDQANGPEGLKLQQTPVPAPLPVPVEAPVQATPVEAAKVEGEDNISLANDFLNRYGEEKSSPVDDFISKYQSEEERAFSEKGTLGRLGQVFTEGAERSAAQLASAPVILGGVAAETAGKAEEAKAAYEGAKLIESYAPAARYGDLTSVKDFDSLAMYMAEGVGEQTATIAALLTGAGAGSVGTKLIAKRFIKNPTTLMKMAKLGSTAGGYGVGFGLETADAAQEFRDRTGSFQPGRALAVGAINGMLEWAVPYSVLKKGGFSSRNVFTAAGKAGGQEMLTEAAQEANTALNAAAVDPEYDFWSKETALRVATAATKAAGPGALMGAAGHALGRKEAPSPEEEVNLFDRGSWENGLTYLRQKFTRKSEVNNDDILAPTSAAGEDINRQGPMLEEFRKSLAREQLSKEQEELISDFEDANTPRFAYTRQDGTVSNVLTDTDIEQELAVLPQNYKPKIVKINLNEMSASGITAEPFDLPANANDPRIFFAPWVKPEEKEQLLTQYAKGMAGVEKYLVNKLADPSSKEIGKAKLQEVYEPLVKAGLRVIPSRGASFIYKGDLKGDEVDSPLSSGRSRVVAEVVTLFDFKNLSPSNTLNSFNMKEETKTGLEQQGYKFIALDTNKIKFDEVFSLGSRNIPVSLTKPGSDIYWFREGLSEGEKKALVEEYRAEIVKVEDVRTPAELATVALALHKKGIAVHPKYAQQVQVLDKALSSSKLVRGVVTPGENHVDIRPNYNKKGLALQWAGYKDATYINEPLDPSFSEQTREAFTKLEPFFKKLTEDINVIARELKLPGKVQVKFINDNNLGTVAYHGIGTIEVNRSDLLHFRGETSTELLKLDVTNMVLHEFGHLITYSWFDALPVVHQLQIRRAYEKTRMDYALTKSVAKTHFAFGNKVDFFQPVYSLTFAEYLAEQARRALLVKEIYSSTGRWYSELAGELRKAAQLYSKVVGKKELTDLLAPSWEFMSALNYMEAAEKLESSDTFFKPTSVDMKRFAFRLTETQNAVENSPAAVDVQKLWSEWKQAFPVGTELVTGEGRGPDGETAFYDSGALSGRQMVMLWMGSLSRFNGPGRLAHEAVHAVWDKLRPGEKALLVGEGKRAKIMPKANVVQYFNEYKRQGMEDWGLSKEEASLKAREYVEQEYAAWLVDARVRGGDYGQVNGLLDRLIEFFVKVKNVLAGYGWTTPSHIISQLYSGELAARAVSKQVEVYRQKQAGLEPDADETNLLEVMPGVVAVEQVLWKGVVKNYFFFKSEGGIPAGRPFDQVEKLTTEGKLIGSIELDLQGKLGYEVGFVELREEFKFRNSGIPYTDKFYNFLAQRLQQEMRPSGILLPDGYKMWKRRNPASVAYHIYDKVEDRYLSPKHIRKMKDRYVDAYQREMKRTNRPANQTAAYAWAQKYTRMYQQIPASYWQDPLSLKAFSKDYQERALEIEQIFGMVGREEQISEAKAVAAIDGSNLGPQVSPFDLSLALGEEREKVQAGKLLKLPTNQVASHQTEVELVRKALRKYGEDNPEVDRYLSGLSTQMDRISWFTKLAISIKQMAFRNQHLHQLISYVSYKDEMNAMRMRWIARAAETEKAWDTELEAAQRDKLTDMLFWATEMEYLPANQPPRMPTMAEIASYMQANGVNQETYQMYQRIESDFRDYLLEVEQVLTANIQRQYNVIGPTGVVSLSPAGQTALNSLRADMAAMRMKPYFPMVRFGEWSVTVRDPSQNNKVVYFTAFPTERERDAAVRPIARHYGGMNVQVGKVLEDTIQFQGIPTPILKAMRDDPSFALTQTQKDWIDRYANQVAPERSFRKRWLRRSNTPGYSLDGMRIYSYYFQGAASYLAKLNYKDRMKEEIKSLRATLPKVRDSKKRARMVEFVEADFKYGMEASNDWHKFKALVSFWQLGFSPAAAFVNLTQTATFTLPYFAGIYGNGKAYSQVQAIFKALSRTIHYSPQNYDLQFGAARTVLTQMGKLNTGSAPELGAYAEGGNLLAIAAGTRGQRLFRQAMRTSMWMFQQAERLNREIVFGMSWELSKNTSHAHLQQIDRLHFDEISRLAGTTVDVDGQPVVLSYDTALRIVATKEAISLTQFEYARDYRPQFMRNPLASSMLVFFGYVQSALFAFGNNPGKLQTWLTYALLFGAMGLPGAEDLDEVIKAIARWKFGKDFSIEDKARELVRELTRGTVFDEVGPDLALHGVSRYSFGPGLLQEGFGIPQFDASANGSMGQLIPGLAETARAVGRGDDWKSVTAELAQNAAGAGFGQIFPMLQFLSSDFPSTDAKVWEKVMPRAVKAMSKANRYYQEERERTKQGGTFVKFDTTDPDDVASIITQALGFTPTKLSSKWEMTGRENDTVKFYQSRKAALMIQMDTAVRERNAEAKGEVLKSIRSYNQDLKAIGLQGLAITSDGLRQSLKARARSRQLQEADRPTQKGAAKLYQYIQDQFPGVEKVK